MSGPPPKPAHLRQRTNRKFGAADLTTPENPQIPELPQREWHPLTTAWWEKVWRSPMSAEYIETDEDGLVRVALLVDEFYKGRIELAAEIRLQESRFGLSPLDRSRLQWEITKGEEAEKKRKPSAADPDSAVRDPRKALRAVK